MVMIGCGVSSNDVPWAAAQPCSTMQNRPTIRNFMAESFPSQAREGPRLGLPWMALGASSALPRCHALVPPLCLEGKVDPLTVFFIDDADQQKVIRNFECADEIPSRRRRNESFDQASARAGGCAMAAVTAPVATKSIITARSFVEAWPGVPSGRASMRKPIRYPRGRKPKDRLKLRQK